ncbi:sugar ABC transporter ATP-binding protein [Intrasporangium sp. YIM S08009]|uniref:sugar ABC transporter ATP-binding protein n=1 Tax=Intrasporangium zincisolvens TaxID=3080018 RepID=UPI002B05BA88|nr:sugar ABC transporter ATP-binding protein [Intrasporangium sp. YIM S08009]
MESRRRDGADAPLLRMTGVVKRFPGVVALGGVDLDVRPGEVHCLLGQNGAGKSTLIKVLAGVHEPDEGTIEWDGETVTLHHPQAAMDLGVATMYQELDLVEGLTVAENIYLGHEPTRFGFSQRTAARRGATELLARLGHREISPSTEVGTLSAASCQIVSMARALSRDARLIIMDEPSAVLDAGEVEQLFAVIREVTAQGVAVVYISHRLEEIREIGDRVTVLKDGRTVATGLDAEDTGTQELIRLMTGRSIEYVFPDKPPVGDAEPVLRVEGLSRAGEFADVTFDVRPGEVVGLAGLVGSGRSEIVETIFGARRATSGRVLVDGKPVRGGSVPAAVSAGIGLCPEERKSQALVLGASLASNISLATLARFSRGGLLDGDAEVAAAEELMESLDVRPRGVHRESRTLSGGNQQKVVLARWLLRGCRVLLLDEPTRGVDVGARSEIYALVRRLTEQGVAVVVVSSEIPEVLGLSNRVLVLADRTVRHEGPAAELDEHAVLDIILKGDAA